MDFGNTQLASIHGKKFWGIAQKKAVDFIRQMGQLFRYVLDSRDKELVPLGEEIAFLEAYSYLLRLQTLGLVDDDQFERIMYRILPFRGERLGVNEIKALAGSVIFDLGGDEFENELLNALDDGNQLT